MKRREFLKTTSGGMAAAAISAPAIAQSAGTVRWRLTTGYPRSIDVLFGVIDNFAKSVSEATEGRFQIQTFAAGEIVGAFQAVDAVSDGTVEMAHTSSYYYIGKDPMFAPFTGLPFLMNARQHNAWLYFGSGNELADEFYAKHNMVAFPAGNSGTQMGGWFRREINTVEDLKGLKFRVAGLAGNIYAKLGVVPQQIPPGDTYPALERGTIDAADWVGPHDDEKLGLVRVAPYYYYPGFLESSTVAHIFINKGHWESLPPSYKAVVRSAAMAANLEMLARYDTYNPKALRRLVGAGAQLRAFKQDIITECYKAADQVYEELSARSPDFKRILAHMRAFRADQVLWWQVSESSFDSINARLRSPL
jgi:TRAP-type mannitol/chloroaromatic compound transport system substrate-binding protein